MKRKPTQKTFDTKAKLEALVERGVNGERDAAKLKLDRLLKAYDFSAKVLHMKDLFLGIKAARPSPVARFVTAFDTQDIDLLANVKWAIEQETGLRCSFRDTVQLWAETTDASVPVVRQVAETVRDNFRQLWCQVERAGINPGDRPVFLMGLYDGMMHEQRQLGQALPSRYASQRAVKAKRRAVSHAPGLNIHPYSLALGLGRQIRFSVPIADISGELDRTIKGQIPAQTT